ncbi:MAG TPA: hypothetical protein PK297_12555 [Spirochaetota bacterium]|nr:hypothetical protein [Spirochaetota bacterium]
MNDIAKIVLNARAIIQKENAMGNHDWRAHLRYMMKIFEMSQLGYKEQEFNKKTFTKLDQEFGKAEKTKGFDFRALLIQSAQKSGFQAENYQMVLGSGQCDNQTMEDIAKLLEM